MEEMFSAAVDFISKFLTFFFIRGNIAAASECVSATRQHKGNKEELGAKPKEPINKPNKTEINGSESFQVI